MQKFEDDSSFFITRNRGHFTPAINYQRYLVFKMAAVSKLSERKRVPYHILNSLSSLDLFLEENIKKRRSSRKSVGIYEAERLITSREDSEVSEIVHFVLLLCAFSPVA